jgi:segregation and condensation protein A
MAMAEKTVPWWRRALQFALGGIRSGFGLFQRGAKAEEAGPARGVEAREAVELSDAHDAAETEPVEEAQAEERETVESEVTGAAAGTNEPVEQDVEEVKEAAQAAEVAGEEPGAAAESADPESAVVEESASEQEVEAAGLEEPVIEERVAHEETEAVRQPVIEESVAAEATAVEEPAIAEPIAAEVEVVEEAENGEQAQAEVNALEEPVVQVSTPEEAAAIEEAWSEEAADATPAEVHEESNEEPLHTEAARVEAPAIDEAVADEVSIVEEAESEEVVEVQSAEPTEPAAAQEIAQEAQPTEEEAAETASVEAISAATSAESEAEEVAEAEATAEAVVEAKAEPAAVEVAAEAEAEPVPEAAAEPVPTAVPAPAPEAETTPAQLELIPKPLVDEKAAAKLAEQQKRRKEAEAESPFSVMVGQVYEGPLDLLLDLIRKQDIDIYDIPIAKITAQFLAYVNQLKASDVDVAGEFIYTASLLIHIKSKLLLPRTAEAAGEAAEDPRRELVERLLEHERFKSAAQMLQQKQMMEAASWSNPGVREFVDDEGAEAEIAADTVDLVRVFREILERARTRPVLNVTEDTVTVGQMIRFLGRRLTMEDKPIALRKLLSHTRSERALIAMFLALLELVRLQAILLRQDKAFSEIFVKKHSAFETVMNEGLANARDDWR